MFFTSYAVGEVLDYPSSHLQTLKTENLTKEKKSKKLESKFSLILG